MGMRLTYRFTRVKHRNADFHALGRLVQFLRLLNGRRLLTGRTLLLEVLHFTTLCIGPRLLTKKDGKLAEGNCFTRANGSITMLSDNVADEGKS